MSPDRRHCTEVRPEVVDYGPDHGGLRVDLVGEGMAGTLASLSVRATVLLITELTTAVIRARYWPDRKPSPPG